MRGGCQKTLTPKIEDPLDRNVQACPNGGEEWMNMRCAMLALGCLGWSWSLGGCGPKQTSTEVAGPVDAGVAPAPAAEAGAPSTAAAGASIGSATMQADGTIVMQLRAEGPGPMIGDAQFVYPPDHPEYQSILEHLGGLAPGETKPVPPWPEEDTTTP
jgi:hypothetical protein